MENILDGDFTESEYETSSDEYVPSSESESEDEVDATPKQKRKVGNKQKATTSSATESYDVSDDEDIPLAQIRRKLYDSDDDIPISRLRTQNKEPQDESELLSQLMDAPFWEDEEFFPPDSTFKGVLERCPPDGRLKEPADYFKDLITDKMLESVAEQTNLYSLQKDGVSIKTTAREIALFLGVYLRMGLVVAHSVKAYWAAETRGPIVADLMSRNRFQKLLISVHMRDNTTVSAEEKHDKLWKLRSWLESLKDSFKKIPQEEHSAVDEVMIPFKGQSGVKQYMRNKPHKWGFKLWGRAGESGILYEFEVYQGASPKGRTSSPFGMAGEVVLRLTSTIPRGLNYKVFADNLFTSLALVDELNKQGILYVGTVRLNRLKGCQLKDEKALKKEGRGSMDSKIELNTGVIALRWYDNRTVDLVSSYVGKEPQREVKRFDRKTKTHVMVKCPKIVQEYNLFMGGIDLLDSLTALYKPGVKSRRWYMYIWYHTIHIALVNAWLRYRRHCKLLNVKHHMKLCTFQGRVAGSLVAKKQSIGRPRGTDLSPPPVRPGKRKRIAAEIRMDQVSHLPEFAEKRGRCQNRDCIHLTYVMCVKCKAYVCFLKERNCFAQFHLCK